MRAAIRQLAETDSLDLIVSDFLFPAVNVPDDLPVPIVLFQHNVEAMIWERHAAVASSPLRRRYLHRQWQCMAAFERSTLGIANTRLPK